MTTALKTVFTLVLLTTTQAVIIAHNRVLHTEFNTTFQRHEDNRTLSYTVSGDYLTDNTNLDSKPGSPAEPNWTDDKQLPILRNESIEPSWHLELGERLIKAASSHDAMEKCGSFISMADYTWCRKAMPFEANPKFKSDYGAVHEYNLKNDENLTNFPKPDAFTALSFGIAGADPWSEFMSGLYFLYTDLFDCYYNGDKFGPLIHDQHKGYSKENPCTTRKCYTETYEYHKVCLDDSSNIRGIHIDTLGHQFTSLFEWLKGRKPLSTFLKMDIEGSEWYALERLLDNDEELAKIRTIDMEVHFNHQPAVFEKYKNETSNIHFSNARPTQESVTHHVEIMERLTKKFAVTGSTLEHDLQHQVLYYKVKRQANPEFIQDRPTHVSTKSGLGIDQYCISFVNRQLL